MNTAHLIPFHSISPILLKNEDFPNFPFFSGTGFFVNFPPYEDVFFVTAKHCALNHDNSSKGIIDVPLQKNQECKLKIIFTGYLLIKTNPDDDVEDVIVYVVDKACNNQLELLKDRCLRLLNQDSVNRILTLSLIMNGKLRAVGYPGVEGKAIDYENKHGTVQPRGVIGELSAVEEDGYWYTLNNINWQVANGDMEGFSGSPILEFIPVASDAIEVIPVGVFSTGNGGVIRFIKINAVTDAIEAYLTGNAVNE
jgi:hypothetical protein